MLVSIIHTLNRSLIHWYLRIYRIYIIEIHRIYTIGVYRIYTIEIYRIYTIEIWVSLVGSPAKPPPYIYSLFSWTYQSLNHIEKNSRICKENRIAHAPLQLAFSGWVVLRSGPPAPSVSFSDASRAYWSCRHVERDSRKRISGISSHSLFSRWQTGQTWRKHMERGNTDM